MRTKGKEERKDRSNWRKEGAMKRERTYISVIEKLELRAT